MSPATALPLLSRWQQTSALGDSALARLLLVLAVLAALWLAVAWAVAVP